MTARDPRAAVLGDAIAKGATVFAPCGTNISAPLKRAFARELRAADGDKAVAAVKAMDAALAGAQRKEGR